MQGNIFLLKVTQLRHYINGVCPNLQVVGAVILTIEYWPPLLNAIGIVCNLGTSVIG